MEIQAFCPYPFNRIRVTSEGYVAFCCFQRPDPISPKSPYLGNVLEQTFDEIWYSELADDVRKQTAAGELHPLCQVPGCPYFRSKKPYPMEKVIYSEYPDFLELDLPNTHCNVGLERPGPEHPACIMCERASPLFAPETDRLMEVLPRIAHLMPFLRQIHVQGISEPFYKDIIFQVMDVLKFDEHNERVTISTTTNGIPFNRKRREEWLKRAPNSITNFSIDAATSETYEKIRIMPVFHQVLENLYAFSSARVRKRQFLRVCNNINIHNVHEAARMVAIAAKANVEYVEFNPTDGFNTEILVNDTNCGLFRKAQSDIIQECHRLKVPYNFIRPLDMGLMDRLVQLTL